MIGQLPIIFSRQEHAILRLQACEYGVSIAELVKSRLGWVRGTCQVCGCTETMGCPDGCAWANWQETLCTRCADYLRDRDQFPRKLFSRSRLP